jgi:hypothetical protein
MENKEDSKMSQVSQGQTVGRKKVELKSYRLVSKIFSGQILADMIYSNETRISEFMVSNGFGFKTWSVLFVGKDGKFCSSKNEANYKILPSGQVRELIEKNFIYFPSGVEEYENTQSLYQEIKSFIKKYVVLNDERFYDVVTGYILMTWVFERFNTVPYLRVIGDLGTGKSRLLEVVGKLCNRAILASGSISTPAVFRTLDDVQGTLVFDEADFRSSEMTDDIVKILNGGHRKDAPVVRMENVGDNKFKTKSFRVFGPKIFASRHSFSDTALESRCIPHRLFPIKDVQVPIHLPHHFNGDTQFLRNKLLMFRFRNFYKISEDETTMNELGFPRLKQTSLALTSVMKHVGDNELKSVIGYLKDYENDLLNNVSTDIYADVVLCIAWLLEIEPYIKETGKMFIGDIASEFSRTFYEDYSSRETRVIKRKNEGPLVIPGQIVSPRKIGVYVEQLGLLKERSASGVYIPITREINKIDSLIERYSLSPVIKEKMENRDESLGRNGDEDFEEDEIKPF